MTVHSDGTVLIEGTAGRRPSTRRASKLELKGGQISLTATQGVTVDGGGGPVKVTTGSQLDLKGGAMASLSAALVKIN